MLVEEHIGDLGEAFASRLHLRLPDSYKTRTNRINFQHPSILNASHTNRFRSPREVTPFLHLLQRPHAEGIDAKRSRLKAGDRLP
jgi:hypothetical protein